MELRQIRSFISIAETLHFGRTAEWIHLSQHYVTWSEQRRIECYSPEYLRNVIRVITETGLQINKELLPMRKEQVDLTNASVWIPDSKTPNGIADVPLTPHRARCVPEPDLPRWTRRLFVSERQKRAWLRKIA